MGNCASRSGKDAAAAAVIGGKPPSSAGSAGGSAAAESSGSASTATASAVEGNGPAVVDAVAVVETDLSIPSTIDGDDFEIPVRAYLPDGPASLPLRASVFFVHGGIFSEGDRTSHPLVARALAKMGTAVVAASFRNGEEAPHRSNITTRDLRDVANYCKRRWEGIPFGLVGSSSGGFFALTLCNLLPKDSVAFCVPICPVAHPHRRASYLRSSASGSARSDGYASFHDPANSRRILEKQLSFWKDDDSMLEAGDALKENENRVPTLLVIGSEDKNVPFDVTKDVQSWATRTVVVGGRGHELCDEGVKEGGYHCYFGDVARFLDHCLSEGAIDEGADADERKGTISTAPQA